LGILICILTVYLILGCLMDALAMVLLTMPIFIPVILALGFDPIWFGVILCLMCEMALITPPVGMNVFVISGMSGVPMYTVFRGIMPFLIAMAVGMVILIAFPQISLWLPRTMLGR
jgi:TRAP-type C4-dicarboxylate transport system permease large subunit